MKRQALCIVAGLTLLGGCQSPGEKQEEAQPVKEPLAVEAIAVSLGTLKKEIRASGIASGIREVYVVSETKGKIEAVNFRLGQGVSQGAVLIEVDATLQKAGLEQAKKAAAAAELNLHTVQKLYDAGSASEAEITGAQSQASGARAGLESARKAFEDCRISAPIAGYIAQKEPTIEKGNYLAPGAMVARIVDISSLKTTVPVGEMEVGILKKGMSADVVVPAVGSETFKGTVTAIAAGSDPATGSYPVEIVWRNTRTRSIKSGMSVSVTIQTQNPDSVVLIPLAAVVEREQKDAVFVQADKLAALRFVKTGRTAGNNVEIIDGLKVGDVLIPTGVTTLNRGEPVAVTVMNAVGGRE